MAGEAAKKPSTKRAGARAAEPEAGGEVEAVKAPAEWRKWRNLWQVPALAASSVLIATGIAVVAHKRGKIDFPGHLNAVRAMLEAGQLEQASAVLNVPLAAHVDEMTVAQKGEFHALVADWIFLSQQAEQGHIAANDKKIAEHYEKSVKEELPLSVSRLERWAQTLEALGDMKGVEERVEEIERLARAEGPERAMAEEAARRWARRMIEFTLRNSEQTLEGKLQHLRAYQSGHELTRDDEAWVLAREAELRLESGSTKAAVEHLLVGIRRVEAGGGAKDRRIIGELHMLLGRGYFDLGEAEGARENLGRALELTAAGETVRGEALVLLGELSQNEGLLDEALVLYDGAVQDYEGTRSYARALLGRAETRGLLGQHTESQADYEHLRTVLQSGEKVRDVWPERVARSLAERYDTAVASGRVLVGMDYARIGESYFIGEEVPAEILIRLAAGHRQVAEDTLASAGQVAGEEEPGRASIPAGVRHEANVDYEQAGEYFLRHSQAMGAEFGQEAASAESLWLAADSFDLGGRHERAIETFGRYIDGRLTEENRRPEGIFRLAQAHEAELNHEQAAHWYEQEISEYPRSPFASQSHTPLARMYLALGRRAEAEQQLATVVNGNALLTPAARDYRDALVLMGEMYYEAGDHAKAIERLGDAVQRYPEDEEYEEIEFRLADSHRGLGLSLEKQVKEGAAMPSSEVQRLRMLKEQHLEAASELFANVVQHEGTETAHASKQKEDLWRRALLYRGDCAYLLGRYEEAVEHYDRAARRYSGHPSSMYALVQIVNCYTATGDEARAETAHHRALVRLQQLPEEAFKAPDSLMDRGAWERWLERIPVGEMTKGNGETEDLAHASG